MRERGKKNIVAKLIILIKKIFASHSLKGIFLLETWLPGKIRTEFEFRNATKTIIFASFFIVLACFIRPFEYCSLDCSSSLERSGERCETWLNRKWRFGCESYWKKSQIFFLQQMNQQNVLWDIEIPIVFHLFYKNADQMDQSEMKLLSWNYEIECPFFVGLDENFTDFCDLDIFSRENFTSFLIRIKTDSKMPKNQVLNPFLWA